MFRKILIITIFETKHQVLIVFENMTVDILSNVRFTKVSYKFIYSEKKTKYLSCFRHTVMFCSSKQ